MISEEIKARNKMIKAFNKGWKYRYDKEQYGMSESHFKMWWMLITHQAGICLVGPSKSEVNHAVLRYKGEYIDNWTKKFGGKDQIEKNHTFHSWYGHGWAYQVAIKMIMSKVVRTWTGK